MKKNNKKGFTLAELLIVVAIIAVLAAIAIPTFSSSLNKAYAGVAEANARSAYAEWMVEYMTAEKPEEDSTLTYTTGNYTTVCTLDKLEENNGNVTMIVTAAVGDKFSDSYTFSSAATATTPGT